MQRQEEVTDKIYIYIVDNSLKPYIDQIDDIELAVNALEQSAYKLDAYSKQLGNFIYKMIFIALSGNDIFNISY